MTDQDRMDVFETRLTTLARAYTDPAARHVDPLTTARTAMASPAREGIVGWRRPMFLNRRVAWLVLAAALVIVIAALAIAVGTRPSPVVLPVSGPGKIVFIRGGDLFVVGTDGANERRIATGGGDGIQHGYLTVRWSPDARLIAAVRDDGDGGPSPHVDVLSPNGDLMGSLDLDPGGVPIVDWAPDGTELIVATLSLPDPNPGAAPGQQSVVDLLVVGTNGVIKRTLDLPKDQGPFVVEEGPDPLSHNGQLAWSPDGRWISLPSTLSGSGSWVVRADGSESRNMAASTIVTNPFGAKAWAPDGRRIAYLNGVGGTGVGCPSGCPPTSIWTVGPDGAPVTFLVGPTVDGDPLTADESFFAMAWSRDGQQLAIVSSRVLGEDTATKFSRDAAALQRFDIREGRLFPVTSGTIEFRPEEVVAATGDPVGGRLFWTPDARRIFFATNEVGHNPSLLIASIDAAGKGPSTIVVRDVHAYDIGFPE